MQTTPGSTTPTSHNTNTISQAVSSLGKQNIVFVIHDQSFPGASGKDPGRGTPYSKASREFICFLHTQGFNGIQLGPQGQTSRSNPSPYDGSIFSKNMLSIDLEPLATDEDLWAGILSSKTYQKVVQGVPNTGINRVQYAYLFDAQQEALQEAFENFKKLPNKPHPHFLQTEYQTFIEAHSYWLEPDALFEVLTTEHGTNTWRKWSDTTDQRLLCPLPEQVETAEQRRQQLLKENADYIEFFKFCQFVVHRQHNQFRDFLATLPMKLFGDLAIGISLGDEWAYQDLFLQHYRMGAPPSRTNPDGQPWGYPILDPSLYGDMESPGPAYQLLTKRIGKMLDEFDGIRLDHPHGHVDPWAYKANDPDPLHAVQNGARIFSSPNLSDHPNLKKFSIAQASDLNGDPAVPRYADDWLQSLSNEQVAQYGVLIQGILEESIRRNRDTHDILCEVLSTCPYPLRRVMQRHGLGQFRVTQKASMTDPNDVYRTENAQQEDWLMVGNHDTKPLTLVVENWQKQGRDTLIARAEYLAEHLIPDPTKREAFIQALITQPSRILTAMAADLFASKAQNIMIFFADFFGMREIYNAPGTVSEDNWSLRVPNDYEAFYQQQLKKGAAFEMEAIVQMALAARGQGLK
ncbi:MAG: 4-alpha-glucanotransferase [Vampirovibrio sp.]|nr:4-alpha-glucanotransferase [Vampirovibrio sp.]